MPTSREQILQVVGGPLSPPARLSMVIPDIE
jgi:hypothetical protein